MCLPNMWAHALVQPSKRGIEVDVEYQSPTGLEDAGDLCQDCIGVLHVVQRVDAEDRVETVIGKGHDLSLCCDEFDLVTQVAVPLFVHLCERIESNSPPGFDVAGDA